MLHLLPKAKSVSFAGYGTVGDGVFTARNDTLPSEGYRITTDADGIKIEYGDEAGKFYAMKTLEQIKAQTEKLPCAVIEDAPKYAYRGFMLDCARHFFTPAEIKKCVAVMATLKLNKFHWHLTDDQGWRLEIKKYPRLTEVGSYRAATRNDGKPVSGFYTQEEVKDIVAYCAERHIEVIPEIDMPGHFTAAVAAYNRLGCAGEGVKVAERFGILPDIACVGRESTLEFCKDVVREASELFPSKYFHLGGDEAIKYRWMDCPDCQKKMAEIGAKDEEELQGFFMNEMIEFVNSLGKTAVIWNDGALGENIKGDYYVQYWKENKACVGAAKRAAQEGKGIIYSPFHYYYLDYPYGMTPLKKTYKCEADDMPKDSVKGLEAPLWTEYVETANEVELKAYPRLFAVADRAWSDADADSNDFYVRLDAYTKYLKSKIPVVTAASPNPPFLRGKIELLKFGKNLLDRTMMENYSLFRKNKRKWKRKYGKSAKKL